MNFAVLISKLKDSGMILASTSLPLNLFDSTIEIRTNISPSEFFSKKM